MGEQGSEAAARRRRGAPLTVVVTGHAGGGRDTIAAALTARFGLTASRQGGPDPVESAPEADLAVHVLGAAPRACDIDFLTVARRPVIVVAGRADQRRDAARAAELAAAAARVLDRPVFPVSGLLAAATIDDARLAWVRRWAAAGVTVPPLAVDFVAGLDAADPAAADLHAADPERAARSAALAVLGATGLRLALAWAAAEPDGTADRLAARLHAESGFAALVAPIRACAHRVAADRQRRYRREQSLAVARRAGITGGRG